jgi:hypothetical protein
MADFVSNSHSTPISTYFGGVPAYEQAMSQDLEWAMTQGSLFFEDRGKVQESLRRITNRLEEAGISYAVAGGMALYLHGYRRYTEDIDILVTRDAAQSIYDNLEGRGYVRPFAMSKNLRDTESGVKIEFLLTGDYPGDGKPKAISFPDPSQVGETIMGVKVVRLPTIIGLKLASWLTGQGRTKDRSDVEELIKAFSLSEGFVTQVDPYSQQAYLDVWRSLHIADKRYVAVVKSPAVDRVFSTLDELAAAFGDIVPQWRDMRDSGVSIDISKSKPGLVYLVSTDEAIARRFEMHPEDEIFLK